MSVAAHWTRVKEIFDEAVVCPVEDRVTLLHRLCGGDRALQDEVESLLRAHDDQGLLLEPPDYTRLRHRVFGAVTSVIGSATRTLAVGQRVGVCEVTGFLGAGGMGRVYRARDITLGRDVALKVLPDGWYGDPDRRARFDREAQLLASLNHPNIGAIYGVQEGEDPANPGVGIKALVLELVDGETLADRIARHRRSPGARGGLPIDDVTAIAAQIIDALEAAHDRGVIHRDLKPANISITPQGRVKVLDFGLAKVASDANRSVAGANAVPRSVLRPGAC